MRNSVREITEQPPQPVYLIHGDEQWLIEQARSELVRWIRSMAQPEAFNFDEFRCGEGDPKRALSAAMTVPMMAPRRAVVVRDVHLGGAQFFEALIEYLQSPSQTTSLVLVAHKFPAAKKGGKAWGQRLPKAVSKVGVTVKCSRKDVRPEEIVQDVARSRGHEMGRNEARLMVELVGTDLSTLVLETEKATLSVPEGAPITRAVVSESACMLAEAVVWDLTAAIAGREASSALTSLDRLLEDGEPPHRLLALMGWQLRRMLRMAELVAEGAPDDKIRKETKLGRDFVRVKRAMQRGFPSAEVVLSRVARANRSMNSSAVGGRRVLESLVIDLCRA